MKKKFIITLIFLTNVTFSQKNENGKVYDKHPAISIAQKFNLALTSGDTTALKELVTEDFVSYNSNYYHPRYKGNGIKSIYLVPKIIKSHQEPAMVDIQQSVRK